MLPWPPQLRLPPPLPLPYAASKAVMNADSGAAEVIVKIGVRIGRKYMMESETGTFASM